MNPESYFEALLDGAPIGKGTTREVYAVKARTDVVIKKTIQPFPEPNITEWMVWKALKKMEEDILGNSPNPDLKNLFAACYEISDTGRYLMMERLAPFEATDKINAGTFPEWLNDKKPSAFGKTAGVIKVMDYAMINLYQLLNPNNRSPFRLGLCI